MKVSIVTISYNQAQYLERAICSVLNQDYPHIEYIIVDPGSNDGSREIIEKYRDQIDHVIFEKDEGPADGLNKGFSVATGDIYGYINADDALLPGAVSIAVSVLRENPTVDIVYGDGYLIDQHGDVIKTFYSDYFTPWLHVHGASVVMQQSTFFKRSAFEEVGGFNKNNDIWWDSEILVDMALKGRTFKHFADKISVFTLHDASISNQKYINSDRSKELDEKRKIAADRLYKKVMGRSPSSLLKIKFVLARVLKWIISPKVTTKKFIDRLSCVSKPRIIFNMGEQNRIRVVVYSHTYLDAVNRKNIQAMSELFDIRVVLPDTGPVLIDSERKLVLDENEEGVVFGYPKLQLSESQYILKTLTLGLRDYDPDIIVVEYNPWSLMFLQALLVRILFYRKAKLVCLVKKNTFFSSSKILRLMKRWIALISLSFVDHIISASEMAMEMLMREFSFPEKKISVAAHLGVDTNLFSPGKKVGASTDEVNDTVVVGYCGRFEDVKGLPDLIDAMRIVKKRAPKISPQLRLLGGGGYHTNMDEELRSVALNETWIKIYPPTQHAEVANFLRNIDIFVLPSRIVDDHQEHDAQALLEALSSGIACIGCRSGIIPEVLSSNTGIIVEPEMPGELAGAILELIENPPKRQKLAKVARETAVKDYSLHAVAKSKEIIYRAILNDK